MKSPAFRNVWPAAWIVSICKQVEGLLLEVVNAQRRASARRDRDLDDETGSPRFFAVARNVARSTVPSCRLGSKTAAARSRTCSGGWSRTPMHQ